MPPKLTPAQIEEILPSVYLPAMKPARTARLEEILLRMNRAFERRRILGLPVAHLLTRAPVLSSAFLQSRHNDLTLP